MRILVVIMCLLFVTLTTYEAFSFQKTLTPEQKSHLENARYIYLQTITLTEKGSVDPQAIQEVVAKRLHQIGYTIVDEAKDAHDVVVKVKCEERKTWVGLSQYGGDADSLNSPSRTWKGPACQITYRLDGYRSTWRREVRASFHNAMDAARRVKAHDSGQFALSELRKQLEQDDFPLLLTTEWGQSERLITLMNNPETTQGLKLKIIPLLGTISKPSTWSVLEEALQDPVLAPTAAVALGQHGEQATETLLALLNTTQTPELKVAAVKGLGAIATHSTEAPIFTALITALRDPDTDIPVQTEIVKALGKLADQRARPVLEKLNRAAWTDPSNTPDMQQLREALSWSLWQLNPDAH